MTEAIKLLTREALDKVQDTLYEVVAVPEWGGHVRVRSLSGEERDVFEASVTRLVDDGKGKIKPERDMRNARAKLCALTMVDAEGARLYSDAEVELLGARNGSALQRVWEIAAKLSGLSGASDDADDAAKQK